MASGEAGVDGPRVLSRAEEVARKEPGPVTTQHPNMVAPHVQVLLQQCRTATFKSVQVRLYNMAFTSGFVMLLDVTLTFWGLP